MSREALAESDPSQQTDGRMFLSTLANHLGKDAVPGTEDRENGSRDRSQLYRNRGCPQDSIGSVSASDGAAFELCGVMFARLSHASSHLGS